MIRAFALSACLATPALADPPTVDMVVAKLSDLGWRFDVTLRHADTGWDHFADQWQVIGPDGAVIATRQLMHPHVDEQPFTRSLVDVMVPDGTRQVTLRARCSQGSESTSVTVLLTR